MVIDTLADAEIIDYYEEVEHHDYAAEKQAVYDEHVFDKADQTTEELLMHEASQTIARAIKRQLRCGHQYKQRQW